MRNMKAPYSKEILDRLFESADVPFISVDKNNGVITGKTELSDENWERLLAGQPIVETPPSDDDPDDITESEPHIDEE